MKVTFQVNESGTRSKNVDLPDAESHIAGNSNLKDEAKALLAFADQDGIPESFRDSDGDEWVKVEEKGTDEGDFYTYEAR